MSAITASAKKSATNTKIPFTLRSYVVGIFTFVPFFGIIIGTLLSDFTISEATGWVLSKIWTGLYRSVEAASFFSFEELYKSDELWNIPWSLLGIAGVLAICHCIVRVAGIVIEEFMKLAPKTIVLVVSLILTILSIIFTYYSIDNWIEKRNTMNREVREQEARNYRSPFGSGFGY